MVVVVEILIFFESILVAEGKHDEFAGVHHEDCCDVDFYSCVLDESSEMYDAEVGEAFEGDILSYVFSW